MCFMWIFKMLIDQYKNILIFLLLVVVIYFSGIIRGLYINNSQLRDKILIRVEKIEENLNLNTLKLDEKSDVVR